jgi:conjugal transfer pilus assembly protein TrbC
MVRVFTALIAVLVTVYASNIFAGNTNDIINREKLRRDKIVKEVLKNNEGFVNYQKISIQKIQNYQETMQAIKNRHANKSKAKGDIKQAIIFVSFSMPDLSLKQIIYDASRYQVPVVIRGLYKNSFRKTIEKLFELIKENNKGGIAINPRWFKEYDIKAVPAVVVSQESVTKDGTKKSDVIYGNIPLKKALSIIAERGEVSNIARNILDRSNK